MLNHLKNEMNVAFTENGARAYGTTGNALLNMFSLGGALRNRDESEIVSLFTKALSENALLAMKMLFYFRDIRGGQGERRTFRVILKYLANNHTDLVVKNIKLIPEFGRWDDLYELVGTKAQEAAFDLIREQFDQDLGTENPSLLAKWLKSENASSSESKRLGSITRKELGLTSKEYRKSLSLLRKRIDVVERKMVAKEWEEINYERVPSKASLIYKEAFMRNDAERYLDYISDVLSGNAKINSKALYPYEIVRQVSDWGGDDNTETLNALWNNLPDYTNGSDENAIAVVDTSSSMTWEQNGLALHVAVSLGMYLAERNTGVYKDHFITFNDRPKLVEIQGTNFVERVRNVRNAQWGGSTNIEGVFNVILNTAIKNKIPQSEMVRRIYIISDMEFNHAVQGNPDVALMESIKERFESTGYEMPELAFINVNARNNQFPMRMHDSGVALVSGMSPTIFEHLMKGEFINPYQVMLDVLESERYNSVVA